MSEAAVKAADLIHQAAREIRLASFGGLKRAAAIKHLHSAADFLNEAYLELMLHNHLRWDRQCKEIIVRQFHIAQMIHHEVTRR